MCHNLTVRGGLVSAFLICQPLLAESSGWSWLNPLPQGNDLNDLHVIDASTIVAVGPVGTVIKTADGGATWSLLDSGSIWELNAVWFTDVQHGWAGSERGMLRTIDGGVTWTQQPGISVNDAVSALQFVDSQTGWAAGGSGKVFQTTDGGDTWFPQNTGLPITVYLERIHFVDAGHGWAFGTDGTVIQTINGGANWEPVAGEMPRHVQFVDVDLWWGLEGGELRVTDDGGQTWTPRTLPAGETDGIPYFKNALEGWFVGTVRIWKTIDGGTTWENQATLGLPDGRALTTLDFRDPDNLWVAGFAGAVYKSTNGGEDWEHQNPAPRVAWQDASFISSTTGWVAGEYGSIYQTTDGGVSWNPQGLPDNFTSGFLSIHFVDAQNGWVVGATGRIYATTDGGETWVRQTSNSTRTLRSVFFLDTQAGWVVGDSGTILHTTDGGEEWSPQTSGVTAGLRAVQFVDSNTGWVVGRSGAVLHTINGGAEWTKPGNAPAGNLNALHFLDAQRGWIVGLGIIYRTTNGGADWTYTVFPLNQFQNLNTDFLSIHFADADHGWVGGADGVLARTVDGGENWELIFNPNQNPFDPPTPRLTELPITSVQFLDANTGWAVGSSGMVLRYGEPPARLPLLGVSLAGEGVFRLSWPQDGRTWRLLSTEDLTTGPWEPVNAEFADESGETWSVELPTEAPAQFFQLVE
ncbi:MAG: hypothetical protein H7A46_25640 [Verrucomicrobiales bacterium]|nr:hypothetical protein [Verrucomicrobiales bacterium]